MLVLRAAWNRAVSPAGANMIRADVQNWSIASSLDSALMLVPDLASYSSKMQSGICEPTACVRDDAQSV
jgi:hypothetical protein